MATTTETEYFRCAEAALAHYEDSANRDHFHGDREAYLNRALAYAHAQATLAVAEILAKIYDAMP